MHRPNLSKNKRSIYFIVALTALLGAFFLLLYFNILPANRSRVNRDVFSILRSSAGNISAETDNYLSLCNEYTIRAMQDLPPRSSSELIPEKINTWLRSNNLPHSVQLVSDPGKLVVDWRNAVSDTFRLSSVQYNNLYFEKQWGEHLRFRYQLVLDSFMLQMESDQQQEFLDQYLLVSGKEVVFKSEGLSLSKDFVLDSFLKKENRFSSGTALLPIDEQPHRIFYFPFQVGGKNMYLCGVVKEADYQEELFRLPDSFIYIIVTLLVLLIITQPILKLPLMSMHEPVRFSGFVLFVGALFAGVSAIALLTVHILMLTGSSTRSESNLKELSAQMERGFNYEVWKTLKVMDSLDINVGASFAKIVHPDSNTILQKEKELKTILDLMEKRETATEIDRAFWIDEQGLQRMKVEKGMERVGHLDVSDRAYFKDVVQGKTNILPLFAPKEFAMEALRNRVNGAFRMVVSKKSLWQGKVVAISTCMSTWCDPLLPRGYGFALVNAEGVVQVHEKESKNLKENLLNRLPDPGVLKEVIRGRKAVFRSNIHLYGRKVDMYIMPLRGYSYFLVTYYKKDFLMPVVLKILVFTIAHVAVIYLVYLLGWLLYFGKRMGSHPRLFAPIHLVGWAIPAERLWSFYLKGAVFLLVGLTGVITAMVLAPKLIYGNAMVFTLIMSSPFQVISGLALIYAWERKVRNVGRLMRWSFFSGHTLLTLNLLVQVGIFILYGVVFGGMVYEWVIPFSIQVLQWVVIVFPLKVIPARTLVRLMRNHPDRPPEKRKGYRLFYFIYLFLLVLMVGALPPSLLTWMSHNVEIEQQIRKQELNLAERVGERLNSDTSYSSVFPIGTLLDSMPPKQKKRNLPFAQRRAESFGYFSPTLFRISLFSGALPDPPREITEPHYYAISEKVAARAYDPMFYPVLPDRSHDGQWVFDRKRDTVMLWYKPAFPLKNRDGLFVKMETGPRFVYFDMGSGAVALTVFVLIVLFLLARVIRYGMSSLFLWKYLAAAGKKGNNTALLARWKEQESFDAFLNTGSPEYRIDDRERSIMKNVDKNRSFFEFLWENCSDKEKFLLFDFALDGLMNYKNSYEITKLVEKGLLVPHRRLDILRLFSASFRLFILTKKNSLQMAEITRKYNRASPLGMFRFALVVVAVAFFTFIFFTQNDVFDKILALSGGIVSVLANLSRITGAVAEKQSG